jgi:AcrR family transcriptional regulator
MSPVNAGCEDQPMTTTPTEGRARPGGRAARVVEAVHGAAFSILDEVGYEQLQLPDVAERAGVNKTTVYRRWPTKVALVADLLSALMQSSVAAPDTGSIETDLEVLLTEVAEVLSSRAVRSVLRAAMTLSDDDPAVRQAQRDFFGERFRLSGVIVERAVARGELPEAADPRRFLELAASPIYFRRLFAAEPVDRAEILQLVSATLRAHRETP